RGRCRAAAGVVLGLPGRRQRTDVDLLWTPTVADATVSRRKVGAISPYTESARGSVPMSAHNSRNRRRAAVVVAALSLAIAALGFGRGGSALATDQPHPRKPAKFFAPKAAPRFGGAPKIAAPKTAAPKIAAPKTAAPTIAAPKAALAKPPNPNPSKPN